MLDFCQRTGSFITYCNIHLTPKSLKKEKIMEHFEVRLFGKFNNVYLIPEEIL